MAKSSLSKTPAALLAGALAADPARPLLTYYDDATGERTELSATTLDNWVAKTANLLVDGSGLDPDGRVAVLLPAHWQTAAVLLGCWSVGTALAYAPTAPAGAEPEPVEVVFVAGDRLDEVQRWRAGDVYALALAPFAAPLGDVPPGVVDFVVEVRGHGDHFVPMAPVDPDAPALLGTGDPVSHAELVDQATERADALGLRAGDRLLVDASSASGGSLDWLLPPLAVGASVVLCANLDPDRLTDRIAAERVTTTS